MNCRSVRDCLVDQWDQPDALQHNDVLQGHLQQCASCQQIASEYARSHQLLQGLPEEEPSENFEWRLRLRLNQVDKEETVDPGGQIDMPGEIVALPAVSAADRGRWSIQFVGSAAAAAVIVTAVGFFVLQSFDSGNPASSPGAPSVVVQDVVDQEPSTPSGLDSRPDHLALVKNRRGLPNLAPTRPQFLKVVPVSAGVPLGPEPLAQPAPSILGEAIFPARGLPR